MFRRTFLPALLLVLTAACSKEQIVRGTPVDQVIDENWPSGTDGVVVLADGTDLLTCRGLGFADREARTPSGCDTVYDIGSITKAITGTAILKLEAMGALDVDDPISAHLGPVPADKRDLTVHHLLTHTAGLPESLGDDYDPLTRDDMIAAALRAPLTTVGEYRYSNVGFSLLAAIIEKASGQDYERFLAEHLFTPAGMTATGYVLPDRDPTRVAVEYDEHGQPRGRPYEHPWAADGPYWNLRGNGGLLSTPRDLYRLHVALTGDTILDDRAKERLFTPRVDSEDSQAGYGWSLLALGDDRVAAHTGGNGWSYAAYARFLGSGRMVFLVANHGSAALEDSVVDLTSALATVEYP
ncbi:hypothetical protein BLA60_30255 [Actinophytocola xinjiangensis]|uniref:Beta-lactamase-related domain-containing protein n=1 Tax=Actinophytocola xinjiangensis TaxID=485602 RepID=A0A7Z1AVJ5_9PSEU|nr:serine hydrolase domain-containing protein [Actinophytocola xinjiangensis]OLF06833.1 hypothetical protein BLA60_30255 [Actinophytocola xinjiangensis]